jgi:peptidoglycan/LPS O-acetylase OafA/YrhL
MRTSKDTELGIDVLRGVAAIGVLCSHTLDSVFHSRLGTNASNYPLALKRLHCAVGAGMGVFSVWIFFVISGFCIHQSILRSREHGTFSMPSYGTARASRIYPLFLLGFLLTLLGWKLTDGWHTGQQLSWHQILGTLAMCQLFTGVIDGFGASWSLTNEAIYYAVWPLILIVTHWKTKRAFLCAGLLSMTITACVFIVWKVIAKGDPQHWLIPIWNVSAQFMLWIGGAWLAENWVKFSNLHTGLWITGIIGTLICQVALVELRLEESRTWAQILVSYTAIPFILMLIAGLGKLNLSTRPKLTRAAIFLGLLSYPCYILHHPLLWTIQHQWMAKYNLTITQNILILLLTTLVLICALGVWIERRALLWRRQILRV